jgi:hypothetical protein
VEGQIASVDVLIVARAGDGHAETVAESVAERGLVPLTFNLGSIRAVPQRAGIGYLDLFADGAWRRVSHRTAGWWFRAGAVDLCGLAGDEAQLAADEGPYLLHGALAAAGVRWIDDPAVVERAELKLLQLSVAQRIGVRVPPFVQTNDLDAVRALLRIGPVVAKAVSPGVGIAPFVDEVLPEELSLVEGNPTLFEGLVQATSDIRVVVVDGQGWAWERVRDTDVVDWRAVDPGGSGFVLVDRPEIVELAARLTTGLGLIMSVQDWVQDQDGPVFLEVNPQGAWLFLAGARDRVPGAIADRLLRMVGHGCS